MKDNWTDEQKLGFALRHAVLAPSGHNTQPWRFVLTGTALHLYADRARRLPVVDPDDRALVISCGAALAFAKVALRHLGHAGHVVLLPDTRDPDLMATVTLGAAHPPTDADEQLFEAIEDRHTHRADFDTRPLPASVLSMLQAEARTHGSALRSVTGTARADLADLVAEGDRAQFDDPRFRRELASWIRSNRTSRLDGMPGYAFGIADLPSLLGPGMVRTFNTGRAQAAKDRRSAMAAPALVVLTTPTDTPAHWLSAGQALGALLLRAAANGVQGSFLNQPIEVPWLRHRVADLAATEWHPQVLLRLGFASGDRPTPRRALADVLTC